MKRDTNSKKRPPAGLAILGTASVATRGNDGLHFEGGGLRFRMGISNG